MLLRSDHRFFLGFGPAEGTFESLPDFVAGGGDVGRTISFGDGRADSSKFVGRAVAFAVGRFLSSRSRVGCFEIGDTGSMVTVESDLMVSSSVNLVTRGLRPLFVGESATTTGAVVGVVTSSSSDDSVRTISACRGAFVSFIFSTVGVATDGAYLAAESDVVDPTGTMVTELALDEAEENTSGVVMAAPNCIGGIAGTGGMPGASELVRGPRELRDDAANWFGSEILRDRPGASR